MATSVLSKEAGLKGKLERCEKRKKETRQNKKNNNTNKETLSFCEENSQILVHFQNKLRHCQRHLGPYDTKTATVTGTSKTQQGFFYEENNNSTRAVHFFAVPAQLRCEMSKREWQGDKMYLFSLNQDTSPSFSSNLTSILSSNWVTCFHERRHFRIVRSRLTLCRQPLLRKKPHFGPNPSFLTVFRPVSLHGNSQKRDFQHSGLKFPLTG